MATKEQIPQKPRDDKPGLENPRLEKPRPEKAHKNAALVALGQHIRLLRESRNFSQEDFAARTGIDRSYYGGIERGERNVAALNLIRIAAALGVEVGELFPALADLTF